MSSEINKGAKIKTRNRVNPSTGKKGVTIDNRTNRFIAYLDFNTPSKQHMHIHIGHFDNLDDAVEARKEYIMSLL